MEGQVPSERSAHIGLVHQHKMYVFGGWNGVSQNNELYCFDFSKLHEISTKILNVF